MEQSLAVKYRPQTLTEVVGQNIVVQILQKAIQNKTFKNSMLFAGKSGNGKTTLARAFARLINNGIDAAIEVDAASQNSVDNVRAIVADAKQRSLVAEYKVFILDECHAFSNQAWQALLKSIEEPSPYTIFIFCTTEPNKIPNTILNRVQRYNIVPISAENISGRLQYICKQEGFSNYQEGCDFISKICNNGMREAITMLEQCADFSKDITVENIKQVFGDYSAELFFDITRSILNKDEGNILTIIDTYFNSGKDLKLLIEQYLSFLIDLLKYTLFKSSKGLMIPQYLEPRCMGFAQVPGAVNRAHKLIDKMLELKALIKYDTSYKSTIEAIFISLCRDISE